MTLEELANGTRAIPLSSIGGDPALTRELQTLLGRAGLLDPPADGQFGPVSQWALAVLLRKLGHGSAAVIDRTTAQALLTQGPDAFPIKPRATFDGRLVQALLAKGCWIQRHPECINILYVEGMDADGKPNDDAPNVFNDLRAVLRITPSGSPQILETWEATTEPGTYYTVIKPLDPRGAARIAFGQYKAWAIGIHMKGRSSQHEALVQTAAVQVHRDLDRNYERTGDSVFTGLFGINQHCGYDMKKSDVGRASAGCLVGRTRAGHSAFIRYCKEDPRYLANNGYRFMTAVLAASDIPSP